MTQDGDNVIKDDDIIPVLRHLHSGAGRKLR